MRFGVVGTSDWARETHAAGVQRAEGAELVGVWGRNPQRTAKLAGGLGTKAFGEYGELLDAVDAVTFSVPPNVQAELALDAAVAGKHVLLEKPVSLDSAAAAALNKAVQASGVGSVVFFTACYTPERRAWKQEMANSGRWRGATATWLASAFAPGSPFDTPWRHEKGALWDLGPHILATVQDGLGPVTDVLSAAAGEGDLVHLVVQHENGATSSITATLDADPAVSRADVVCWGDQAVVAAPSSSWEPARAFAVAVEELIETASSGREHPYDVSYGCHVVDLLAAAERLLGR